MYIYIYIYSIFLFIFIFICLCVYIYKHTYIYIYIYIYIFKMCIDMCRLRLYVYWRIHMCICTCTYTNCIMDVNTEMSSVIVVYYQYRLRKCYLDDFEKPFNNGSGVDVAFSVGYSKWDIVFICYKHSSIKTWRGDIHAKLGLRGPYL